MFQQSELDNYKLQVELLQEKLTRSEDQRVQLEGKMRELSTRKKESEKSHRSKARLKYQQFLDEQKLRNERNKRLVQMLEQIDQQAAALSARSERLKMMKIQYEMYFARVLQSQCYRPVKQSQLPVLGYTSTPIPPPVSPPKFHSTSVGVQSGDGWLGTTTAGYHSGSHTSFHPSPSPTKTTFEDINYSSTRSDTSRRQPSVNTSTAAVDVATFARKLEDLKVTQTPTRIPHETLKKTIHSTGQTKDLHPPEVAAPVKVPVKVPEVEAIPESEPEVEVPHPRPHSQPHPSLDSNAIADEGGNWQGGVDGDGDGDEGGDEANPVFDSKTNGKPSDAVMWNFNGRIDPRETSGTSVASANAEDAPAVAKGEDEPPKQFAKKEKMSLENIENVIYGELINPQNPIADELLAPVEQEQPVTNTHPDSSEKDAIKDVPVEAPPAEYEYEYQPVAAAAEGQEFQYQDDAAYQLQGQEGEVAAADPNQQEYQYQQEYYDQSQYQTEYDPSTYGYTYDEQTGQYTDPNGYEQQYQQEYAAAEGYAEYAAPVVEEATVQPQELSQPQPQEQEPLQPQLQEQLQPQEQPQPLEQPQATPTKPSSILSTDKSGDSGTKKKKRVNFVDSETDESSAATKTPSAGDQAVSNESDFDFSAN